MKSSELVEENKHATIRIQYCPACGWMLRASWMAQEILSTFTNELKSVTLEPAKDYPGLFQVRMEENLIWCRKKEQGFPQPKELKRRIRDLLCPEKDLGHSDRKH